MNKNDIGHNAGKIWKLLSDNTYWSCAALQEKSGLSDKELGAAIGWLARENKIEFKEEGDDLCVYLCVNVYIG